MENIHTIQHRYLNYNIDLWPEDGEDFDYVGCFRVAYGGSTVHVGRIAGHGCKPSAMQAAWRAGKEHVDSLAAAA